jgi:hypothetical protein
VFSSMVPPCRYPVLFRRNSIWPLPECSKSTQL